MMAKAKYKQYFEQMLAEEKELFENFRAIHNEYKINQTALQEKYNLEGERVVAIIRDWERRLCSAMGRTIYSQYAQQVSEKFWDLVRKEFDQIDMVGVKIEK